MHFIARVTMLFANNSLINGMSDHHEIFTHYFLHSDVIFSSHTMFNNASTKEFTISSYDIAFKELLYYRLAPPIL